MTETYQSMLENHHYPEPVQCLLGDLLVATSLLTATLKFEGDITVQIQGDGPVRLAVINGNNNQQMRGVARVSDDVKAGSTLKEMIGNGFMVITVTPEKGERYQGIVALDGENIEACIDNYFKQSEQLPTRVFIRSGIQEGKPAAAGMLLQVLPASEEFTAEHTAEHFELLTQLTHTIKAEELFTLDTKEILHRLYHEEDVTLYEPQAVEFHCTCSRERCENTLVTLSKEDVNHLLQEQGNIDMECEYCGTHYIFTESDINNINKLNDSELH